jgi:hypothetical protein
MADMSSSEIKSIEGFSELCGFEVGKDCDEMEQAAVYEAYKLYQSDTAKPVDFAILTYKLLNDESKKMPLTPLSQRGLEKFIDYAFIDFQLYQAVKTSEGRIEIMKVLHKLAQMKQYMLLSKSLLWGGKGEPPAGYTLYRSKQKDGVMKLINSLPKGVKNDLLSSVWSYYCNGGFKITGERIFGDQRLMPL